MQPSIGLCAGEEGKNFTGFTADAEAAILRYAWPGNVRELQNVMRQVFVLHSGETATLDMLPADMRRAPGRRPVPSEPSRG